MTDCLFCKIINNEIPSYTLYEDDIVKVFLDINPTTNGDCLIIPKRHYDNIMDIDNATLSHMFNVIRDMYTILKEKLKCDGLTICENNDYSQEIKHFHIHITPRYKNDLLKVTSDKEQLKELDKIHKIITN